ncbi:MAG: hypothetical protein JO000_00725 [Alphaproteobacteria bacterium]|nr:hypothetical protein [Alphaproteobacteria bacterium]
MSGYVEPPHVGSTLRWEDVWLPSALTAEVLDATIFSMLQPRSLKTARIIGDVVEALRRRSIDPEIVGARIQVLVDNGSIEALGNPRKWRHSELLRKEA